MAFVVIRLIPIVVNQFWTNSTGLQVCWKSWSTEWSTENGWFTLDHGKKVQTNKQIKQNKTNNSNNPIRLVSIEHDLSLINADLRYKRHLPAGLTTSFGNQQGPRQEPLFTGLSIFRGFALYAIGLLQQNRSHYLPSLNIIVGTLGILERERAGNSQVDLPSLRSVHVALKYKIWWHFKNI